MRHPFEDKIGDFITRHQLLNSRHRYLVALSGGADSVCLLRVLSSLGYEVEAVHCNFHLRGEESDRDEQFCEQLCKEQNTPFHRVHFDTQTFANLHHLSIEMAARELRYQYFHQLSQSIDIQGVCVAHHLDDNVETVLMNLLRGTGIHGLTGMRPSSFLPVKTAEGESSSVLLLRPLLCASRREIEGYLADCGATFVTDSSNLVPDVMRNKIRLQVLPLLHEVNPSASENIALTAERMEWAEELFDEALQERCQRATVDETDDLKTFRIDELTANEYVLFTCLHRYGFNASLCEDIHASLLVRSADAIRRNESLQWESASHVAVADRGELLVYRKDDPHLAENLAPKTLPLAPAIPSDSKAESKPVVYGLGAMGRFVLSTVEKTRDFIVDKSPDVACLDAEKVSFPLVIRPMMRGDSFQPYGMKGTKLVSDYLTDRKRSLYEKRCQLVMADAAGQIAWLIGERTASVAAVSEATRYVLTIERQ
jgi:tRNA(Ile)-lysidine synthase